MFLAKALYDNIAESPDELAFRRGDVLTVTELDTGGLDGWWLCTLRGKQGIAPGNRLKILSGMSDYSFGDGSISASCENLTARRSCDSSNNESIIQDVYDEPNKSFQDYDVPPSRYHQKKSTDVQKIADSVIVGQKYEVETSSIHSAPDSGPEIPFQTVDSHCPMYDVPQQHRKAASEEVSSNRSSILSNTSSESCVTASGSAVSSKRSSSVLSVSDSARSSLDVSSQELYDTPCRTANNSKQLSADSGLDIYDIPPAVRLSSPGSMIEDYDFPRRDNANVSKVSVQTFEQKLDARVVEHGVDDVYDVPKNNTPRLQVKNLDAKQQIFIPESRHAIGKNEPICVYDIPPQVTRDSVISCRSDSSEEGQRLSTCSIESRGSITEIPTYDEMPFEMDAALELLTKLQQDVQISVTRFSGFVSSTWRKRENLQTKLYEIKLASTSVKNALNDFIQFSQGTLANSAKLPDKKLVNKLYKQLNPLQNCLQLISSALKNLDDLKWQIDILAEPLDSSKSDDLGQIANLCKDLCTSVRKLSSLIQGNATLLFSKSHDLESVFKDKRVTFDSISAAKPPIVPKPEPGPKRSKIVQQRPLPAPPTANRPLPPTPIEDQMNSLRIRFQENDVKVADGGEKDDIYANDTSEWTREYDYVHLESKDISAQLKVKDEIKQSYDKNLSPDPSDSELKDQPDKHEDPYETKLEADLEELDTSSRHGENDNDSFDIDNLLEPHVATTHKADVGNDVDSVEREQMVNFDDVHLDPNDKQVLVFYLEEMKSHSTLLDNALRAFLCCVDSNEPPKVFISHSKFVIVSAHKLVYIGDTLHRNVTHTNVKNKIMLCANQLCDCLKHSVSATKLAALQYPSELAVQEMVDRVIAVSKAAHNLKFVISQASTL